MKKSLLGVTCLLVGFTAREIVKYIQLERDLKRWSKDEQVDVDDYTRKYPPKMVYICDGCESMMMCHLGEEDYKKEIEDLKTADSIMCAECGHVSEIDYHTYKIINAD